MDTFADYSIIEHMSAGNHGTYFRATPPPRLGVTDEFVTLKVLGNQAGDDDFMRLSNELRLLHSLQSDHVVELLDAGNADGQLFLVTRYYPAGPIGSIEGLSKPVALQAIADAATGAHELHEVGVAHRDIHPNNILLDEGRGRLADLGLASMLEGRTTGVGPIGSLEFIDPSVIRGNDASRRSDIWSLGLTAHRVLAGTSVYGDIPSASILEACRHVLHTPPALDASLDAGTRAVIEKATAPDPKDRHRSAAELATDLAALI